MTSILTIIGILIFIAAFIANERNNQAWRKEVFERGVIEGWYFARGFEANNTKYGDAESVLLSNGVSVAAHYEARTALAQQPQAPEATNNGGGR